MHGGWIDVHFIKELSRERMGAPSRSAGAPGTHLSTATHKNIENPVGLGVLRCFCD